VIAASGKEALRAVNARAAAAKSATAVETAGDAAPAGETTAGDSPAQEPGDSTATTVIRGDNPHAAGLANVWLELRKTLTTLTNPAAQTHRMKVALAEHVRAEQPDQPEQAGPQEPGEGTQPGTAAS
jgi:hypothetical protein